MKLHRPYIPIAVRVQVAERQLRDIESTAEFLIQVTAPQPASVRLAVYLRGLFGDRKSELHHRPALLNRRRYVRNGKVFYDPPANDPAHLVYLDKGVHDVETRVRGLGALRSDLGQARYNKNVAKNREKRSSKTPAKARRPKRKWASRPLRNANRWPERT